MVWVGIGNGIDIVTYLMNIIPTPTLTSPAYTLTHTLLI